MPPLVPFELVGGARDRFKGDHTRADVAHTRLLFVDHLARLKEWIPDEDATGTADDPIAWPRNRHNTSLHPPNENAERDPVHETAPRRPRLFRRDRDLPRPRDL